MCAVRLTLTDAGGVVPVQGLDNQCVRPLGGKEGGEKKKRIKVRSNLDKIVFLAMSNNSAVYPVSQSLST